MKSMVSSRSCPRREGVFQQTLPLTTGRMHYDARRAMPANKELKLSCCGWNGRDMSGRHNRTFQAANNNFFKWVVLVKRADRASARRRGK
jgi:hypothetical protein